MRYVLFELPGWLFFALVVAISTTIFARDLLRWRRDKAARFSSVPLWILAAAEAALAMKAHTLIPAPRAISGWSLPVYSYGTMLGASLMAGWFLTVRLARQDGIAGEVAATIYMWTVVWSLAASRLLHVVVNPDEFRGVTDIFLVNRGGLVAYGGMIGGFLASWYCCWKRKIPLLLWADAVAPSVVLGTAITRVGCLLHGCDFGARSSLPWAISFPKHSPAWLHHVRDFGLAEDAAWSFPVHPTQVYESMVGLLLLVVLMSLRRHRRFSGQVFLAWVIGYGIFRPLIEIFRDDAGRGNVGALSTSQFIGIVSVVLGAVMLVCLIRRYRQDPASLRLWEQARGD